MAATSDQSTFGIEQAQALLDAGWRQGSLFRLPEAIGIEADYDPTTEWLVVCTQSCAVVSKSLIADPMIEVIVATQLEMYLPKSPKAMGKEIRKLHLPVTGLSNVQGIECDINRRFSFPRSRLLEFSPAGGCQITFQATKQFAGWLGRYYTRVALPNELVTILNTTLFKFLERTLKSKTTDGATLADGIVGIYINWEPIDEELASLEKGGPVYHLKLLFLCETDEQDNRVMQTLAREASIKSDNEQLAVIEVSAYLFVRALTNFQGCLLMMERGMIVEAKILLRSLLEDLFYMLALNYEGAKTIQRMAGEHEFNRASLGKAALSSTDYSEVAAAQQLEDIRQALEQPPTVAAVGHNFKNMANIAQVSGLYLAYKMLSSTAAHPSFGSLQRYIEKVGSDRIIVFEPDTDADDFSMTMYDACSMITGCCLAYNELAQNEFVARELGPLSDQLNELNERSRKAA